MTGPRVSLAPLSPDACAALRRASDTRAPSWLSYGVAFELRCAGMIVSMSDVTLTPLGEAARKAELDAEAKAARKAELDAEAGTEALDAAGALLAAGGLTAEGAP